MKKKKITEVYTQLKCEKCSHSRIIFKNQIKTMFLFTQILNSFIEVYLIYNKLHIFELYSLVSWTFAYTHENISTIKILITKGPLAPL